MGFTPNRVTTSRWDTILKRLCGLKERSSAPTVATELLPVLDLNRPDVAGDDEITYWVSGNISPAVALAVSNVLFAQPAGTKGRWTLDGCLVSASASTEITIDVTTVPGAFPPNTMTRLRNITAEQIVNVGFSSVSSRILSGFLFTGLHGLIPTPANFTSIVYAPMGGITMLRTPNLGIFFGTTAINTTLYVTAWGRYFSEIGR